MTRLRSAFYAGVALAPLLALAFYVDGRYVEDEFTFALVLYGIALVLRLVSESDDSILFVVLGGYLGALKWLLWVGGLMLLLAYWFTGWKTEGFVIFLYQYILPILAVFGFLFTPMYALRDLFAFNWNSTRGEQTVYEDANIRVTKKP